MLLQRSRCVCIAVLCIASTAMAMDANTATAENAWTGWLGPQRNGWVSDFVSPDAWPEKLTQAWAVDVGEGYGTPLVDGDRIYQHSRQGDDEVLLCIDLASGDQVWKRTWAVPFKIGGGGDWHGAGPKANPVMADGRVFTISMNGVVTAWDTESGEQIWQRDERKRFPTNHPYWGASSSPIVDGNRLLIHLGNDDVGALFAFDVASGETIWEQGKDGISYSSPLVVDLQGVRQVIDWNHQDVAGIDVATGDLLWAYPLPHVGSDQNSPTPVLYEDSILIGGENRGVRSLRPSKAADGWKVDELWMQEDLALNMSTAVVNGDRLFGFSHYDSGRLFCLSAEDGSVIWKGRPRSGDNVTFLAIPDRTIALMDGGELRVIDATSDEYQIQAKYEVSDQPTWAAPVLGNQYLLVKDRQRLIRWDW